MHGFLNVAFDGTCSYHRDCEEGLDWGSQLLLQIFQLYEEVFNEMFVDET